MIRRIEGGTFDTDSHRYLNEQGVWVPSVTQIISSVRYSDFGGVLPSVLENAANRGSMCHWLTEAYDADGELPPPSTSDEIQMRFDAYREWRERERFVPDKIEYPVIASVYGMQFGCTLDRTGTIGGQRCIVELKFTSQPSRTWGIQLAAQEIAITKSPAIGQYLRVVCHVNSKGKAKTIVCTDPQDAQRFVFALGVVWTRIDFGYKVNIEVGEGEDE